MSAQGFRVLTKEELEKLSMEERIAYMRKLVSQMRDQIKDTDAAIKARQDRLNKPE